MTHENVDRLRFEIDSGRTGDKVAGSDPAAAPLGTDEEAAGTPIPPHAIGQARALEGSRPHEARPDHGPGHAWILIGFVLACAAALLTWAAVLSARPAKPVADGPSGSGLRSLGDAHFCELSRHCVGVFLRHAREFARRGSSIGDAHGNEEAQSTLNGNK